MTTRTLALYSGTPHPCGYLPGHTATTLFPDPRVPVDTHLYSRLIDHGFRRSGEHIYRPHCQDCNACIPVRIPVAAFQPNRVQKRTWRRNADLQVSRVAAVRNEEHFALYRRYLATRHPGGGMDDPDPEHYLSFFTHPRIDTAFYEFRLRGQLLAVAIVDHLEQGLSAVYTFFDPDHHARSLGVYAVLWQIEEASRLGLPWVYLGYWIEASPKMRYKSQYRPLEAYRGGRWNIIDPAFHTIYGQ